MSKGAGKVQTMILDMVKQQEIVILSELPFHQAAISRAARGLRMAGKVSVHRVLLRGHPCASSPRLFTIAVPAKWEKPVDFYVEARLAGLKVYISGDRLLMLFESLVEHEKSLRYTFA